MPFRQDQAKRMHERGKSNEEDDARDPKFHGVAATVPHVTSDH